MVRAVQEERTSGADVHVIPAGAPLSGTDFIITPTMGGVRGEMEFSWSGYNQVYHVALHRRGEFIRDWLAHPDVPIYIKNWNTSDPNRPDLRILFFDASGNDRDLGPVTLASNFVMVTQHGRFDV